MFICQKGQVGPTEDCMDPLFANPLHCVSQGIYHPRMCTAKDHDESFGGIEDNGLIVPELVDPVFSVLQGKESLIRSLEGGPPRDFSGQENTSAQILKTSFENKPGTQKFEIDPPVWKAHESPDFLFPPLEDSNSFQEYIGMGINIDWSCSLKNKGKASRMVIVSVT